MWIVRLALRRPYTFVVMAVLIAILGGTAIVTMPVDIFPYIDIPVVSIVWSYQGLSPEEMEKRMVTIFERSMTTTVNDIEHIESQSYSGVSVTRVYFQPNVKIDMALAQVTAISQTLLRIFPPGTTPPNILKYDASSVPILQLGLESKTLSEQAIFDYGLNFIRTQLATVQGAAAPLPYGGKFRQIMVDLNPDQLYAKGISATDVSSALGAQSIILPAGDAKIGNIDYQIKVNSSPRILDQLNDLPIRVVNGATVYIKDVAQVRDGYAVQTSIVRTNGTRGTLMPVLRNGKASTLAIVNAVKQRLPQILAGLPPELHVRQLFDQSLFVRAAINGVVREAVIAAFLTAMMILLFLGSWRSTIIVCISIPLSILTSLADPEPDRRDHQRDDVGRHGAGRRHPGGRCHCRNREHPSQHGDEEAAGACRARWRTTNRRAGLCFHAFHLHRVRSGPDAHRRSQVSVHAPGPGGGLRHDGFLPVVAHPDSQHGAFHA